MTKEEAKQVLEQVVNVLYGKGMIQVAPSDYDKIKQAVEVITSEEISTKAVPDF